MKKHLCFVFLFIFLLQTLSSCGKSSVKYGEGASEILSAGNTLLATLSREEDANRISLTNEALSSFVNRVISEGVDLITKDQLCSTDQAKTLLFSSGFTIKTTFDEKIFQSIEAVFSRETVIQGIDNSAQAAVVISDKNGRILASKGSTENDIKTDNAATPHKPGSSIKPLSVYAPGIDKKVFTWSSQFTNSKITDVITENGKSRSWPSNYSNSYSDLLVSVEDAFTESLNTVAVRALQELTVPASVDFMEKGFGIDLSKEKELLGSNENEILGNIALGYLNSGFNLYDSASYYCIFINKGQFLKAQSIESMISNNGYELPIQNVPKQVISNECAEIMIHLLQNAVLNGTAKLALSDGIEIAGKTGTTSNHKDNWFVGFTNEYVLSVWVGFEDDRYHAREYNPALPIFKSIVSDIYAETESSSFVFNSTAEKKEYCTLSGKIAGNSCELVRTGYYLSENIPDVCDFH